jgi:transcription antitermination factor NusG
MVIEPPVLDRHWFALYTKPRHEFKAAEKLRSVSIELYLPTIIVKRKWSDRKRKVEVPLFNGYIFIYASEKERLLSLQQEGIVRTITFLGKPSIIPEWQIESLRKMLSETPDIFVSDKIEEGTKIKITEGPFEGVTGIVKEADSEKWLFVNIEILNRAVSVKLSRDSVVKNLDK